MGLQVVMILLGIQNFYKWAGKFFSLFKKTFRNYEVQSQGDILADNNMLKEALAAQRRRSLVEENQWNQPCKLFIFNKIEHMKWLLIKAGFCRISHPTKKIPIPYEKIPWDSKILEIPKSKKNEKFSKIEDGIPKDLFLFFQNKNVSEELFLGGIFL